MELRYKNSLPWGVQVSRNNVLLSSVRHQFGRNTACPTTYTPVSDNGLYRTPQSSSATALRIKAGGNAADTANGTGARSIKLYGLNAQGDEITEVIATAGALASQPTTQTFVRLYLAEVHESGTYGTQSSGSHAAAIVIENATGTEDWASILLNGFPSASTSIGSFTIPRNHVGLVTSFTITVDQAKTTDVAILGRNGILDESAPYKPITKVQEFLGIASSRSINFEMPLRFDELTDVGVLAKVSNGTGAVSIDMEILLLEKG